MFDDYIRCMSAKQRLYRRRTSLRHIKLQRIAQLLELPVMAVPTQQLYPISRPSLASPSISSPRGFLSRPGGAVAVSDLKSNSTSNERPVNGQPMSVNGSTHTPSDSHRMAAPESCLQLTQTSGDQARALASVLDISDAQADDVIEVASDSLEIPSINDVIHSDHCIPCKDERILQSAPATPRGQRRFGRSTFHILEWQVSDLNRSNSTSEPSLLFQSHNHNK